MNESMVGSPAIRKYSISEDLDNIHKLVDELMDLVGGLESRLSVVLPQNVAKPSGYGDTSTPPDPSKAPLASRLSDLRGKINLIRGRVRFMLDDSQL